MICYFKYSLCIVDHSLILPFYFYLLYFHISNIDWFLYKVLLYFLPFYRDVILDTIYSFSYSFSYFIQWYYSKIPVPLYIYTILVIISTKQCCCVSVHWFIGMWTVLVCIISCTIASRLCFSLLFTVTQKASVPFSIFLPVQLKSVPWMLPFQPF